MLIIGDQGDSVSYMLTVAKRFIINDLNECVSKHFGEFHWTHAIHSQFLVSGDWPKHDMRQLGASYVYYT